MSQPVPAPAPRQALQQRVAAAILEAAARVFAARGEQASMSDVAAAAGVARATLYRYFPSRQTLLDELADLAVNAAVARLASSRIHEVAPEEGITRAVRALVDVGDYFVVLVRELRANPGQLERRLAEPLLALFERGQSTGDIRRDVPSSWLTDSLIGLVVGVLPSSRELGTEDLIAAISSLFLDGARAPQPRSQ
ncbi:MAG: TetR family transcriptional regulator [Actinomycetota bacterium]|nr:TetR family transcriptional regulator [Actinomycetota bacterium]